MADNRIDLTDRQSQTIDRSIESHTSTTLQELKDYCCIPCPAGALMLVGEWGCGKTYLIEHELRESLSESHIIIRISLFGMTGVEEIHKVVKDKWIRALIKDKTGSATRGKLNPTETVIDNVQKGIKNAKEAVSTFVPGWAKRLLSVRIDDFITINSRIGDRTVVLVFDDLERAASLDTVDILGCINDYIEDKHFHVIILANEEAILENPDKRYRKAAMDDDEFQYSQLLADAINKAGNRPDAQESDQDKKDKDIEQEQKSCAISYRVIKEKIVQRTIECIPDYKTIINDIISGDVVTDLSYRDFLGSISNDIYQMFTGSDMENKNCVPPHNLRSLKCALQDFERVYRLLVNQGYDNGDDELRSFFFSFTAFLILTRSGIMHEQSEDVYDRLNGYSVIRVLYAGYYDDKYICKAEKEWIQKGRWEEALFIEFMKEFRKKVSARTPVDKLLTNDLYLLDENEIKSGWPEYLQLAYSGGMSLNEYVQMIRNSYWARECGYELPEKINWLLVEKGISQKISDMIATDADESENKYLSIGKDGTNITTIFSPEEVHAYDIISSVRTGRGIYAARNKKLYISSMNDLHRNSLSALHSKVFWYFDEDMVNATFHRFKNIPNEQKIDFISEFRHIWRPMLTLGEVDQKQIYAGFCSLREKLKSLVKTYTGNDTRIKKWITSDFLKALDTMIKDWEKKT